MDAPPDRDTAILRHVMEGDVRAAGTLLVHGHADEVYAMCRAMLRDGTLAEDVSQDVFVRAFKALPAFRGEASVRTWILRITRNRCIDELRARKREPRDEPDEPDAQPAPEPSIADLVERRQDVRAGLEALGETERALVVLRFGHGLGYPELADAFDLAQGAVRMRLSRAVAKMRAAIEAPAAMSEAAFDLGAPAPRSMGAPEAPARRRRGWLPWRRQETADEAAGPPPARPAPAAPGAPPPPAAAPARASIAAAGGAPPSPFASPAPSGLRARLASLAGALG